MFSTDSPAASAIAADVRTQCASGVLLIRPRHFGYNEQTAASNRFQSAIAPSDVDQRARAEFDRLRAAIEAAGVRVCVLEDTDAPVKPDAVFPNNWISFHHDGTAVLYPMQAINRRGERRMDALAAVESQLGFRRRRLLDLRAHEAEGRYLEGTGSLVLDHVSRRAFACRSPRTDESLALEWARQMDYRAVLFDAVGPHGHAPYHTNVMLSIGAGWVVVCAEAIAAGDRPRVMQELAAGGREVIRITPQAMRGFAANILELAGDGREGRGPAVLVLSQQALTALQASAPHSWERLRAHVDTVVAAPLPTLEGIGGGSARCVLAEVPEVR